ncbi:hypothetical protein HJFPF1_00974 [Paramyrothecium foliicola]|nr:hypothetical protein HJFPF1_00974 [Paramyrothecium foliicola]
MMAPLSGSHATVHHLARRSQTTTTTVVIVGLALVAAVSLGLLAVVLVTRVWKRKPKEITEKPPTKWHDSLMFRRSKPMQHEPSYDDDVQREVLIRKSLASRAESRASGQLSPTGDEDGDIEEQQDLRTDWKQFEARVQHERSISLESHPALGAPPDEHQEEEERTQKHHKDMELLRPISTISSLTWSPLDTLPQFPTMALTAGAPTYPKHVRSSSGGYDQLTMDEDTKM